MLSSLQEESIIDKLEYTIPIVSEINQILQFPLNDEMVTNWSETILEANKDVDLIILKFVVFMFKIGDFEYDQKKGIINIFNGLKRTFKLEGLVKDLGITNVSLSDLRKIQREITALEGSNIPSRFHYEKIKNYANKLINNQG